MKVKDLYKLEKGGTYFLRLDPALVKEAEWRTLIDIICPQLRKEEDITIVPVLLRKDAIEFLPKKPQRKER